MAIKNTAIQYALFRGKVFVYTFMRFFQQKSMRCSECDVVKRCSETYRFVYLQYSF